MGQPAKILIVDDEPSVLVSTAEMLAYDHYQIMTADSGQAALELISVHSFDLALIDLNLGDMTGIDLLNTARQTMPETIIIMLTAYGTMESAIEALRLGAHDYLLKPCRPLELRKSICQGIQKRQQMLREQKLLQLVGSKLADTLADIQTVVKVQPPSVNGFHNQQPAEQPAKLIERGRLKLDLRRYTIFLDSQPLELSPTEFGILAYLLQVAPRVVSPQELMSKVQGYDTARWEASETVRAHIAHIRKKMSQVKRGGNLIRTVRGVGYRIAGEEI
jgi:DNA-binding response OmpR family regulator